MGRYRPPRQKGSPYITAEGAKALEDELHRLWKVERPTVTAAVHAAALNGDRSENGDYIYGKRRLREIDSRVRFLRLRLDELKIVDSTPSQIDKVYFGAWVSIENDGGKEQRFRLVGPDEFDLNEQRLSVDSPMGRALLGKSLDQSFSLETPEGIQHWTVTDIVYET